VKTINHPYVKLTPRQQEILHLMSGAEDTYNSEIVCEGIHCWLGTIRVSFKTVKTLLQYVLISGWKFGANTVQYLHINESGKRYLAGERLLYQVNDPKNKNKMMWTDKPIIVPWF